jgi:pimeloyl-ACP methyl ester carboxylesterase
MRKDTQLSLLGLFLALAGGLLAMVIQTSGGQVKVQDLRFNGPGGSVMSALLYVPATATAKTPAPAILAVHGYINSRETQDAFAIEFARRGYVVLALDQTGHGYSDPPAFANGFGGPAGLSYLRGLDIVDKTNIGLEGHSMGGWTILAAAATMPDAYQSMVLEGSSTGAPFAAEGTPVWPRNLAVVFSKMDEFSPLMWAVPRGADAPTSPKLQTVFASGGTIEVGKVYGSTADGSARVLYQPWTSHPGDHISNEAVGHAISWFGSTLKGGKAIAESDQVWVWKEIGTFAGFIGMVLFLLGLGSNLLQLKTFAPLVRPMPEPKTLSGAGWWLGAALAMALPIVTYFAFFKLGALIPASWLFPQTITTQIVTWAVLNGLISLVLFLLWHALSNKKAGGTAASYGLSGGPALVAKDLLLAVCVVAGVWALLGAVDYFFKTDFRLWILALKPLSAPQLAIALRYVLPLFGFFLVSAVVLHGQMRLVGPKPVVRYLANAMLLAGGFAVFLVIQYVPLLAGGTLFSPDEPLNVIVAIQFLPLLIVVSLVSTWFFEKTGRVWTGAFINAMFVTWYIVAGQATQFPL